MNKNVSEVIAAIALQMITTKASILIQQLTLHVLFPPSGTVLLVLLVGGDDDISVSTYIRVKSEIFE